MRLGYMACEYLVPGLRVTDVRKEQPVDLSKAEYKYICKKYRDLVGYTNSACYIKDEDYVTYCKTDDYKKCRVFKGEVDTDGNPIFR